MPHDSVIECWHARGTSVRYICNSNANQDDLLLNGAPVFSVLFIWSRKEKVRLFFVFLYSENWSNYFASSLTFSQMFVRRINTWLLQIFDQVLLFTHFLLYFVTLMGFLP